MLRTLSLSTVGRFLSGDLFTACPENMCGPCAVPFIFVFYFACLFFCRQKVPRVKAALN